MIEIAVVVDYVIVLVNAIVIDQLKFKINVCYNITVKTYRFQFPNHHGQQTSR